MSTPLGDNLKERIGNTPLLRFDRLTSKLDGVQVLAKAEWANPGGSVKDRAASNIVSDALLAGKDPNPTFTKAVGCTIKDKQYKAN